MIEDIVIGGVTIKKKYVHSVLRLIILINVTSDPINWKAIEAELNCFFTSLRSEPQPYVFIWELQSITGGDTSIINRIMDIITAHRSTIKANCLATVVIVPPLLQMIVNLILSAYDSSGTSGTIHIVNDMKDAKTICKGYCIECTKTREQK